MSLEQDHPLKNLEKFGLEAVNSWFPWQNGDITLKIDLHFAAERKGDVAEYLSEAINDQVCQNCPFRRTRNGITCTRAYIDGMNQVAADLRSSKPLNRDEWREVYSKFPCKPTLVK